MDIPVDWNLVNNDVGLFSFNGQEKEAKVVDVYDGDTCSIVIFLNKKQYKQAIEIKNSGIIFEVIKIKIDL